MSLIDMSLERIYILTEEIQKLNTELKVGDNIENTNILLSISSKLNEIKGWARALLQDEEDE